MSKVSFWLLPIYAKIRDLHHYLFENTRKGMPKDMQMGVVASMREETRKMMVRIGKVSNASDKQERIGLLIENMKVLEDLKYDLRSLKDCHYLTPEGFGRIARQLIQARRQHEAFAKSLGASSESFPSYVRITQDSEDEYYENLYKELNEQ